MSADANTVITIYKMSLQRAATATKSRNLIKVRKASSYEP